MKYLIIRHNTDTHCIFQELRYPCQYHDFLKEEEASLAEGWTHIKTLAVIPVDDDYAFIHDEISDWTSARYSDTLNQRR